MTEHVVQLPGGTHFTADADENLLAAAQRAHWLVRYGCRNGNCQACAATLLEGCVVQRDATIAATPTDNPAILLCLCRARSDLQIALPGDPLHGSGEQARRYYARVNNIRYDSLGSEGTEAKLHITLPAGRTPPVYPGQYFQLEHHGEVLRADVDTALSTSRDLYLHCATARDFAADRYLSATGPLGYCYAMAPTSVLILRDSPRNLQARLLHGALPDAQLCDATHIADFDFAAIGANPSFDAILACTLDPELAEQWYRALLERGIAFDEFRSDDAIRYRWRVWREDDNANRFPLATALSEEAARHMVDDYQRRGHKQLYWAEPMTLRNRG
jgi:ferredoxin